MRSNHRPGLSAGPRAVDGKRATAAFHAVTALLELVGEDTSRDGLLDTPERVVRALLETTRGYDCDIGELLDTRFEPGQPAYGGIVLLRDVPFASTCEHHLLPFTGTATVAYIPNPGDRLLGLSKLARLVDAYALRLQSQERMTSQIVEALVEHLQPAGAACIVKAEHSCLNIRGVRKHTGGMVTSELRGLFFDDLRARDELLALAALP
jgi:GTP cyclohydrolase IA